jgi:DNA-binding LytR/AlgR family response regulator
MTSSLDEKLYNLTKQIKQVNYLIKPIQALSLISTVEKILEDRRVIEGENVVKKLAVYIKNMKNEYCIVYFCDILLIESQGNYSTIITKNQKYTLKESLKSFAKNLDERFIRCHQKYVINTDHIKTITKDIIQIAEYGIPLGRTYKNLILLTPSRQENQLLVRG